MLLFFPLKRMLPPIITFAGSLPAKQASKCYVMKTLDALYIYKERERERERERQSRRVVLPEPEGPMTAMIRPDAAKPVTRLSKVVAMGSSPPILGSSTVRSSHTRYSVIVSDVLFALAPAPDSTCFLHSGLLLAIYKDQVSTVSSAAFIVF